MIRKIFLLLGLALCLTSSIANAQIVTSKSKAKIKIKKPPFEKTFYVAGGGTMNTATNKYLKFNPGFEGTFGYEQNFKRDRPFGSQWGMELGFTTQGYKYEQLGFTSDVLYSTVFFSPYYSCRIGLGKSKKTYFEPFVGLFVCYYINNDMGDEISSEYHYDYKNTSYEPYTYMNVYDCEGHFNAGINAGTRFWLSRRFSLDVSYRLGFNPEFLDIQIRNTGFNYVNGEWQESYSEDTHKGMSSSIVLRLGVRLNK